jgi:hypothetical protein
MWSTWINDEANTTGIWAFAECRRLCRVLFIGHSAKKTLPSTALGKVLRSVKSLFTECRTLGTEKHSANTALPSGKHSAKMTLGKGPSAAVYSWRPSAFAEDRKPALGKEGLYRVSSVDTRQSIFLFFYFVHQTFYGMFLHYVDLHVSSSSLSHSLTPSCPLLHAATVPSSCRAAVPSPSSRHAAPAIVPSLPATSPSAHRTLERELGLHLVAN